MIRCPLLFVKCLAQSAIHSIPRSGTQGVRVLAHTHPPSRPSSRPTSRTYRASAPRIAWFRKDATLRRFFCTSPSGTLTSHSKVAPSLRSQKDCHPPVFAKLVQYITVIFDVCTSPSESWPPLVVLTLVLAELVSEGVTFPLCTWSWLYVIPSFWPP